METFKYDIVIIIILGFSLAYAYYRGIFKELRSILSLVIPMTVLLLTLNKIISLFKEFEWFVKIVNTVFDWISYNLININLYKNTVIAFTIAIVLFFILRKVTILIVNLFQKSKIKRLASTLSSASRMAACAVSFINVYIISFIGMAITLVFTPINNNTAITYLFLETSNEYLTITEYVNIVTVDIQNYEDLSYKLSIIDGTYQLNHAEKIYILEQEFFQKEDYIANNIIPLLDGNSIELINNKISVADQFPYLSALASIDSGKAVYDVVKKNNKKNINRETIESQYYYVMQYQGLIKYLNNPSNSFTSPTDVLEMVVEKRSLILNYFSNSKYKIMFENIIDTFSFYSKYSKSIYAIVSQDKNFDLNEYNLRLCNILTDNPIDFMNKFRAKMGNVYYEDNYERKIIISINEMFTKYTTRYLNDINKIRGEYDIVARYVLGKNYRIWFEVKAWEKLAIINCIVNDSICYDTYKNAETPISTRTKLFTDYIKNEYLTTETTLIGLYNNGKITAITRDILEK